NRKQRQIDIEPVTDFSEPREISSVAAMKNRAAIRSDDEPAEIPVRIRKKPGAPMVTWRERNFQRAKLDGLPIIEFVHDVEPEIVHQISYACRDDDRLVRSYAPQCTPVEVIKMCMRHQDEINRRQMLNFEPRLFQALDHFEPFRPNRVDQDVDLVRLNQKRRMPNPSDADLAFADLRKMRRRLRAGSLHKKRWNQNTGENISLRTM